MHGVVGAVRAGAGILAEDFDPTVQPSRGSFWAFLFLAVATVLLVLSFLRHLRRVQANLGPAEQAPGEPAADPVEGDSR
jgi:hypothetical protein